MFFAIFIVAMASGVLASAAPSNLTAYYSEMLNHTCGIVRMSIPNLPAAEVSAFMTAYQAFNGSNDESEVFQTAGALLSNAGVKSFMSKSWTGDSLDTAMVQCAVLFQSTPAGLAAFAGQGSTEFNLVAELLNDTLLMRDMLVAGGAASDSRGSDAPPANFGQAMQILQELYKASTVLPNVPKPPPGGYWDDRNQSTMLRRLALGTALGHAVPLPLHWADPSNPNITTVDPVARYLNYEKAYLEGKLDPAIEVLTAFECRWTTNSDAIDSDLDWVRTTFPIYRPEDIAWEYDWRYAYSVHKDVPYQDPQCLPGICDDHYVCFGGNG